MEIVERDRWLDFGTAPESEVLHENELHRVARAAVLDFLTEQRNSGFRWSSEFIDPLAEKVGVPPSQLIRIVFGLEGAGLVELGVNGVRLRARD